MRRESFFSEMGHTQDPEVVQNLARRGDEPKGHPRKEKTSGQGMWSV